MRGAQPPCPDKTHSRRGISVEADLYKTETRKSLLISQTLLRATHEVNERRGIPADTIQSFCCNLERESAYALNQAYSAKN